MLILLAATVFGPKYCASQSKPNDTLCFSLPQVRNLLIAAKQKSVLEERVAILNYRIDTLYSTIALLKDKDAGTVRYYEAELKVKQEEQRLCLDQVATFEKMIRRQKRRTTFSRIAGALTTAGALYLFIQK